MIRVGAGEFIRDQVKTPVVDVRSPAEYAHGHIPEAINIPVFSNEERAEIGTLYKKTGKPQAIERGFEIVGPRLKLLGQKALKLSANGCLNVYCWRGGMRSEKMAWLFDHVGLNTCVLEGGYKAYRKYILSQFEQTNKLIILQGPTGSGKTDILKHLEALGEQVIDLEGLAHHKGSAFGGLGMDEQPTTQQFQNNLYSAFQRMQDDKRIWIESESLTIGKVYLPETLWASMNSAPIFAIQLPRRERLGRVIREYGVFEDGLLINKVKKLRQRFGTDKVDLACEFIMNGDLTEAASLLLDYYDHLYSNSARTYKKTEPVQIDLCKDDPETNARHLISKANEYHL